MIKAIETHWKGYRFRSRLEARWAVFFEEMGWNWQYEPQGFELERFGSYLPDFYVEDVNAWLEIKPKKELTERALRRVYLAGKIQKNCWRHSIAYGLRDSTDYDRPFNWPEISINDRCLLMTGPYFRSCDHGCGHSPASHGQTPSDCFGGVEFEGPTFVLNSCLNAISKSDIFFVWIDSLDCYGTLVEAGFAKAHKKNVVVGISSEVQKKAIAKSGKSELWFLLEMADTHGVFPNAKSAFNSLVPYSDVEIDALKISDVAKSQGSDWGLMMGDPVDRCFIVSSDWWDDCLKSKKFNHAAFAARSARFEHGEKPRVLS